MRRTWTLLPFLIAAAAYGQTTPPDFERVLVPIYLPQPISGAYGTAWTSQTILFTDTAAPLRVFPGCDGAAFCDIQPRTSFFLERPDTVTQTESRARFVYVARAQADQARFSACLRRGENDSPCEPLPIAREADFKQRIVLPFVPLQTQTRAALRVYGLTSAPRSIHLRMYRLDRIDPFVDEADVLVAGATAPDGFDPEPSHFIVLDMVSRWPPLQAAASVRIEIDSPDRVWAFASVTSNATQEVSIFRP